MIEAMAFYMFAAVTVFSGLMVIGSKNPVHSVLFLILAFFSSAGLFVLLGAEFLAMILVIVYVGAVAVLFLFVVMMLDIDFAKLREGVLQYLPVSGLVGVILLAELVMIATANSITTEVTGGDRPIPTDITNTQALGNVLYTDYIYLFQGAGLVLLVAMIGAIVLTNRSREGVKKQVIADQVARTAKDAIELKKIEPGEGI